MTSERWQQIKELFHAALECDASERAAFLARACDKDAALKVEVEALIAANERDGGFIDAPAYQVAAEWLAGDVNLLLGQQFNHYKILDELGAGGMGEVYLAEDTKLGRKIALKVLPASFTDHRERLQRFQREARTASALNHPNIVTIHEFGEQNGRPFIAAELIEGKTLRERISSGPLPPGETIRIAVQIASALSEAHSAGVVHRDVKPENVMVRADGIVKVLDFGLAKLTEPEGGGPGSQTLTEVRTNPGALMGTTPYMSPEQVRGLEVDAQTDVWSLGCVMYEMSTGRPAFSGETNSDVMVSILEREPPSPSSAIPAGLNSVIARALQKRRENRYNNAREIVSDLKSLDRQLEFAEQRTERPLLTDETANPSKQTTSTGGFRRPIFLARFGALVFSVLLLVLIAGLFYFRFWRTTSPAPTLPIKSIAVLPFKPLVAERPDASLEMGIADTLITRLSRLNQITVRPISSVRKYNTLDQDPVAAGRELGVDAVLEGGIQWDEDKRIRVTARLWRVADHTLMWTNNWVEQRADIFALEDLITERMARSIEPALTGDERKLLTKHYTDDVAAYRLYLKGRYELRKRSEEGLTAGIKYFNDAIARDPQYALAFAGLADGYLLLSVGDYGVLAPKDAIGRAKEAATRALELDDALAEAHTSLGFMAYVYDWDWTNAQTHFRRAIELNSNYATAHHWYALCLAVQGKTNEGMVEAHKALEIDPLSPIINTDLGLISYYAHQYGAAIEQLKTTLTLEPGFAVAHWRLGLAYAQSGKLPEAESEIRRSLELSGRNPVFLNALGYVLAASGKQNEARQILAELRQINRGRYVFPNFFANIYLGLNDKEQAILWLQRAYEDRCSAMAGLKVEPMYDPLRGDPRFRDLLKRVGLSE